MARNEQDREDLIREATALEVRAELLCTSIADPVTVGFWRDGRFSVYFDQDPFFQFDVAGKLRRAFREGHLFRSQAPSLIRMHRDRSGSRTTLRRDELTASDVSEFRLFMIERLQTLSSDLSAQRYQISRSVGDESRLLRDVRDRLCVILEVGEEFLSNSINARP